jgi:hypothetical protein
MTPVEFEKATVIAFESTGINLDVLAGHLMTRAAWPTPALTGLDVPPHPAKAKTNAEQKPKLAGLDFGETFETIEEQKFSFIGSPWL